MNYINLTTTVETMRTTANPAFTDFRRTTIYARKTVCESSKPKRKRSAAYTSDCKWITIEAVPNNSYQQDFTISFVVLRVDMNELQNNRFNRGREPAGLKD